MATSETNPARNLNDLAAAMREAAESTAAKICTTDSGWRYDDGITDTVNGVDERGKMPWVDCTISVGSHALIAEPSDYLGVEAMDLIGRHIAAANPANVLALLRERERLLELLRGCVTRLHDKALDDCSDPEHCPWADEHEFMASIDAALLGTEPEETKS